MIRFYALILALIWAFTASAYTVVIDAGHGGRDAGALGLVTKEKHINLAVALALGKMITENCPDVKVVYTRQTDVFVELNERAAIANRAKADLFISIHTNSTAAGTKGTSVHGTETYTLGMHRANDNLAVAKRENSVIMLEKNYEQKYEGFDPRKSESYIIFELMQDRNMASSVNFARNVQNQFQQTACRVNKGVYQAGFLVLRQTSMPSVLIELGYINNANEESFLNSTSGQQKMAQSIFNAFRQYSRK
ncbi:MAG: N-acetylmuramoyl-L-alanine amidase [Bacteroidaceae bacterium]|nr:N-acetylmuramoyl-L-alanine amidase [Bacteroidaceae bacterium]